jgi:GT2 family glycosyltransferase
MELSIVILNYKSKDLSIKCVDSIVEQYKKELDNRIFEIILVDNNSEDSSVEEFEKLKIKGLNIVKSKDNLGFGNGCNLGAKKAQGEYLLFLNSDTEIKDQGFLRMLEFMKKNEHVGILGGRLKNPDGTNQPSCGKFYNLFYLTLTLLGFERAGIIRKVPLDVKRVDWVSGACMMIRKKTFEKIGGFAKEIFMYVEDMEICYRAKKKGFLTYFYPNINLFHIERGSSNKTFAVLNIYKGILYFYKKHKSRPQYQFVRLLLFLKALVLSFFGKLSGNKYLLQTYGQALELF